MKIAPKGRPALAAAVVGLGLLAAGASADDGRAPGRRGLHDPEGPVAPKPIAVAHRHGRDVESPRPRQRLGAIAKIRRGRYVMSRLKELKAGRESSTR